jgi:hypothetical protein
MICRRDTSSPAGKEGEGNSLEGSSEKKMRES